jgi:predicted AAA+ superfamily ATPase
MIRIQKGQVARDLEKKMVFMTGPRQVGKTTLARSFKDIWPTLEYLNWDSDKDRPIMFRQEWNRQAPLVILDEVHKMKNWKSRIKGVYDTEKIPPRILVTGSARLDRYRRGGDSLAGRYFLHRLYPFSVRELISQEKNPNYLLDQLIRWGGFPEPFFAQSEDDAQRWRKGHLERILREDVRDLESIRDIAALQLLVELLRDRAGSRISYASLARDIQVSPHTIKHWIQILESMYILFRVTPYHRNLARALLKEPKLYFFDNGSVRGDSGAKLENVVAVSLLKWLHYLEDTKGVEVQLHYLRDKEQREVDFAIVLNGKLHSLIEVKTSDQELSNSLHYYTKLLKPQQAVQLVQKAQRQRTVHGIQIIPAADWLANLDI